MLKNQVKTDQAFPVRTLDGVVMQRVERSQKPVQKEIVPTTQATSQMISAPIPSTVIAPTDYYATDSGLKRVQPEISPNLPIAKSEPTLDRVKVANANLVATQSQLFDNYSMFGFLISQQRQERWQSYKTGIWKKLNNLTKNRTREGSIIINVTLLDKLFFVWRNLSKSNIVVLAVGFVFVIGLGWLLLNQYRIASANDFRGITIRYK